jgi:hypothetical protein
VAHREIEAVERVLVDVVVDTFPRVLAVDAFYTNPPWRASNDGESEFGSAYWLVSRGDAVAFGSPLTASTRSTCR